MKSTKLGDDAMDEQANRIAPATVLHRLRIFLFALSGALCLGSMGELLIIEHTGSLLQWLPIGLCGLGILAVTAVLVRPQRVTVLMLRVVMGSVAVGSVFGIYEHLEHNFAFELEIRPNALLSDVWLQALGVLNPLLAPGILAIAALIALAATYQHPSLFSGRKRAA